MKSITQRNSAIELLRIISMVFIVMRHYSTQVDWGGWTAAEFSFNTFFLQLITIGGLTANNIFILISGYFTISSGLKLKNLLRLAAELFFYSWVIAAILYGFRVIPFSIKGAIKAAFPIWFGYNWYVCCYLIFCCFVPFLNEYLNSISQKTYLRLLFVSLFLWSFARTFQATTYLGDDFSVDHFIVMYMLGGYIRLYGIKLPGIKRWWAVFAVLQSLMILSVVFFDVLGYKLKYDYLIVRATYFSGGANILDVMTSVALFLAVLSARPFHDRRIDRAAGSAVGIFLIHHNPLFKQVIWEIISPNINYLHSPWLPLHMLVKVSAVFVFCLSADLLRRRFIEPPFVRWIERIQAHDLTSKITALRGALHR